MKPEKNAKAKSEKPKNKSNNKLIIGIVIVILLAGIAYLASSSKDTPVPSDSSKKTMTLKEARAKIDAEYGKKGEGTITPPVIENFIPKLAPKAAGKFPDYVYTNPLTLKAYKFATEHPELLEQIPCYCGCGGHSGHRFLRDCYLHDDGTYDNHASFCDVCVGEAIKVQSYMGLENTPFMQSNVNSAPQTDLSALSLPDNFRNIADGLKLTPAGIYTAYFTNIKMLTGTELEEDYVSRMSQPSTFYGKKLIAMYSADYSATSWIEMHDLGYDSTNDSTLSARKEDGMKNIVNTRPLIYGHSQNVDNVVKLMGDPKSMNAAYPAYKPILDAVDYQNAGFAQVKSLQNKFSDLGYMSLTPINGKIELIKAYYVTDNNSIPAAFNNYNPQTRGNILIIKVTGDLATVNTEKDKIDQIAK